MNPQNNFIPQTSSTPQQPTAQPQPNLQMNSQPSAQFAQPNFNQPAGRPVAQPAGQPFMQPATQPAQPFNQPFAQPTTQPIAPAQAITQPAAPAQAITQPVAQPTQQPAAPALATPTVAENPISTQSTLLISELRDGIVIMKDGSFRAVIACQSINFDLMSEQECEGVEYSYQNFLNSLSFTVQILIRSQRVDIGPYIERLIKMRRDNDNMLLGVLMDDYINFIDVLSQEANIMDKAFFIVVPYYSSADAEKLVEQTKNIFKTFGKNKGPSVTRISRDDYDKAVDELNKRVDSIMSGLFQIGIQSARLNTKELSELYYNFNNPDTAVREPLVDFSKLATTYVRKGDR